MPTKQTKEFIQILENLTRMTIETRGNSYDYKKGINDAQWFYYKEINKIKQILNQKNETQMGETVSCNSRPKTCI
jgi:hypothetical protein